MSTSPHDHDELRKQLARMQGILGLSMVMVDAETEQEIVTLASSAVSTIPGATLVEVVDEDGRRIGMTGEAPAAGGSDLCIPLRTHRRRLGQLVVSVGSPDDRVRFALEAIGHMLAVALSASRQRAVLQEHGRLLEDANQALARSNKDLEQFAYAASHDLSEPLRAIAGPLGLVRRRHAGQVDPEALEFMDYALDACDRMQRIIDGLLEFSRVGRLEAAHEPVESAALFGAARRALQVAIDECGATVTAEGLPVVIGEGSQLERVFQNLIGNAIKFGAAGTSPIVHVAADRRGEAWRFTVTDNGIGIPAAQRERIFEMFKRLHTREEYQGNGLGLALCKRIIVQHGGEIGVEDSPADVGTRIWFTLPVPSTAVAQE